VGYHFYFRDYDYPPDIDLESQLEQEPEPKVSLENEIGKLLEILVIGLTGKGLDEQRELVTERLAHVSTKISKSNDNFGERLANESEGYMIKIINAMAMNGDSIEAMLWKLRKTKYAIERFEGILHDEMQLRKDKNNLEYI
jgi:hypothetical protein